jgi:hypothetical protein
MTSGKWISFSDRTPPVKSNGRGDNAYQKVLVTNNINARNAFGDPSHVWLGSPVIDINNGEWRVYDGGQYLTHWFDPFSDQNGPSDEVGSDMGEDPEQIWKELMSLPYMKDGDDNTAQAETALPEHEAYPSVFMQRIAETLGHDFDNKTIAQICDHVCAILKCVKSAEAQVGETFDNSRHSSGCVCQHCRVHGVPGESKLSAWVKYKVEKGNLLAQGAEQQADTGIDYDAFSRWVVQFQNENNGLLPIPYDAWVAAVKRSTQVALEASNTDRK